MQAYSPVSTSTSEPSQTTASTSSSTHALLTIDPAALLGGSAPPASTGTPTSGLGTAPSQIGSSIPNSIAVKQEPEDEQTSSLTAIPNDGTDTQQETIVSSRAATEDDAGRLRSISAAPHPGEKQPRSCASSVELTESKSQLKEERTALVDELLLRDHKAILRPDLSAFADARDALRRLLPYHVWTIPHHDLLTALGLKEDPVLSEVRSRKRRRLAKLDRNRHSASRHSAPVEVQTAEKLSHAEDVSAQDGLSTVKLDRFDDMQLDEAEIKKATSTGEGENLDALQDDTELNELGLPVPLPEVPQPVFPTLDYAESVFSRRDSLALRFRRTLTALDTTHRRAPNTSLSLEQLERLAYNDDREEVLAQIEELKSLKSKLESLEEGKDINVAESSAKIKLSFGITDEIERERERERELERIKRQQERAAAKAAKLEKEREARHRIGIFTPPPEPPSVPTSGAAVSRTASQSPAFTAAATPAPGAPPLSGSAVPTPASLPMTSPYSAVSTPGGYPFPTGVNFAYPQQLSASQAGPNGFPVPASQYGAPSAYGSMPGVGYGSAPHFAGASGVPSFGPNGMPIAPGVGPMGTPTSVPFLPATTSIPGTPSTPLLATPSKPPSKSKAKAPASGAPGTPGTPGVTPGPTPHRGRGRPRKHPLPGTPGGPPLGSSVPRKKKEKPTKPPAAALSSSGTPGTPGAAAMSPPALPTGGPASVQIRPSPASTAAPTMPGPAPGYSGEAFASTLPPTPVRPLAGSPTAGAAASMGVRPPTMHPTLTSATSLNTPRATPPAKMSPSPASPAPSSAATTKKTVSKTNANVNGATSATATPSASASASAPAPVAAAASSTNPSIPNHPIPLLIPVASLPRLSALGIQPAPSPHIRPIIGPNGQPQGLQGLPVPIDPAQSIPAVLLGISEGTAEANSEAGTPGGKQQILHISVVLSRLSPSQLSGLAVLMQSLQAQVEAGKRK